MAQNIILTMRPARDDDEPFLRQLFSVIDTARLKLNELEPLVQKKIIHHQFEARSTHFKTVDMDHSHCIILTDNQPVGRIIIMQDAKEIRLADLAILPAYRRRGIATAAIQGILSESIQSNRPVTLHVHKFSESNALALYLRLGFRIIEHKDTHYFMQWSR